MAAPSVHLGLAGKFATACEKLGVRAPESIALGLRQIELANAAAAYQPPRGVLSLSPDEIREHVIDMSVRRHHSRNDGTGLEPGVFRFNELVQQEVAAAVLPELERVVADLRPMFEERAQPIVVAAQRFGFTLATTSDAVINLADEGASAAWRDLRTAWSSIDPIVRLRRQMSEVFEVAPTRATIPERLRLQSDVSVNPSVCFAAGDNWDLEDGFVTDVSRSQLDWLQLAVGGLRLNSPTEVAEKIADRTRATRAAQSAARRAEADAVKREADRELTALDAMLAVPPARHGR